MQGTLGLTVGGSTIKFSPQLLLSERDWVSVSCFPSPEIKEESFSIHTHKQKTRLGVNLSKSGPKRGLIWGWVTRCDLLGQVASSVG